MGIHFIAIVANSPYFESLNPNRLISVTSLKKNNYPVAIQWSNFLSLGRTP